MEEQPRTPSIVSCWSCFEQAERNVDVAGFSFNLYAPGPLFKQMSGFELSFLHGHMPNLGFVMSPSWYEVQKLFFGQSVGGLSVTSSPGRQAINKSQFVSTQANQGANVYVPGQTYPGKQGLHLPLFL